MAEQDSLEAPSPGGTEELYVFSTVLRMWFLAWLGY